jgi:ATP-binding cassette, subfamily B, multidrug efflux pump
MTHVRWIWRFWQPHLPWLWILAFLTLLSSAVTLAFPKVLGYVIDNVKGMTEVSSPELATSKLWPLIGILIAIGVARSLANLYPGTRALINGRIEMDVRQYHFERILEKGYRFFCKFRTGDLVTRLTDDISNYPKIAWFACSGVFRAVESGSKFVFCIIFMMMLNWQLALLTLLPLPVMLFLFYRVRTAMTVRALERQEITSRTSDALEAAFSGIRILKAFTAEQQTAKRFNDLLEERVGVEMRLMQLWMGMQNIYGGIMLLGQLIVVFAGGLMVVYGHLTVGNFFAFYLYVTLLLPPLMDIPNLFVTSRQAFACIDREIEIEQTSGATENIYNGTTPLPRLDCIEVQDATFTYDGKDEPALSGINLKLAAGQRVAVIGAVGSGKSTLLKMMAGLLPPTSGALSVNGRPLTEYSLGSFRKQVGYVPQEATLFSETVSENVRFGREMELQTVEHALGMAQVLDELKTLPNGLDQVLGQRGLTISGGQKQRLAIARALAGQPRLLLMDDCTSALDAENERAFWESFRSANPDAACLIITHRLATARQADTIVVLEHGRLAGVGTHEQLLETCEPYRNFLSREELKAALKAIAPSLA